MKMMKKLAMSLALGLGLSLLGGGQGIGALQTNHQVLFSQPEVHGTLIDRDTDVILSEINELRNGNKKKKDENYANLKAGGLSDSQAKKQARGPFDCGNVLVAHVNVPFLPKQLRYIVLQSGLTRNASAELTSKIRGRLTNPVLVLDGAQVIKAVSSGHPEVIADIRTLAGGENLTGANQQQRLQAIVQALKTYAEKCRQAGFTDVPSWADKRGFRITDDQMVKAVWRNNGTCFIDEWAGRVNSLTEMLQNIFKHLSNDNNSLDNVINCVKGTSGNYTNDNDFIKRMGTALWWLRYTFHTEIQLGLLIRSGMELVPHSPILSWKDPCPSCEQGANSAWDHQDHKFFSFEKDEMKNHTFSLEKGTIIQPRYCTWK